MDLPKAEAERMTATFTTKASSRGDYYNHRKDVENWLRTQARNAGVIIVNQHPIYFRLTKHAEELPPESGLKNISLPVGDVDLSLCSFTLDDSFCNYEFVDTAGRDSYGVNHHLLGQVFNAQQLEEIIRQHNLIDYLENNEHSYLEVQMWSRPHQSFI